MCLFTHNIKPMTCNKDIAVIKFLLLESRLGMLSTPYRFVTVRLGEMMKAKGKFTELPLNYSDNRLDEGLIHASIKSNSAYIDGKPKGRVAYKAIIKAGTPFFVSFDLGEVAATEMYLTEERVTYNNVDAIIGETQKTLHDTVMSQGYMSNKDGVRVGDVLLPDLKTFVHKEDITPDMEAIGIVGFMRPDGKPQVIALAQSLQPFYNKEAFVFVADNYAKTFETVAEDFNGYEETNQYKQCLGVESESCPSFEYCLHYETPGTKKGDWYLPAAGEILQTVRNIAFVNETLEMLGKNNCNIQAEMMDASKHYWSSTISDFCVYGTALNNAQLCTCNTYSYFYVRPFLHLP